MSFKRIRENDRSRRMWATLTHHISKETRERYRAEGRMKEWWDLQEAYVAAYWELHDQINGPPVEPEISRS